MLIDLHTHTRLHSWDAFLSPDELIEGARQAGLDGVCLTEHDFFWDSEAARQLARKHDFVVIPAVEINTEEGHVLCFGLEKYVYGMHRWPELSEHVKKANGAMIAAHPYRRQVPWDATERAHYLDGLEKAVRNLNYAACVAIEEVNGRGREIENQFSAELCERLDMRATAGSDSHAAVDIGSCATEFLNRVDDSESLIAELTAGNFHPVVL